MKYEEFQEIANALISSNDKMIYLNLVIVLLGIVAVYFTAVLKKSGELAAIKSGFDDIRKQNEIITTDTESIRRQIEKGTIEFQIKLSKYHDRKIESIDLVYQSLAIIYRCSTKMPLANEETKFDAFYVEVEKFRDTLESKKIWLDPKVCESIENFAITVDMQVRKYQGALNIVKFSGSQQYHLDKTFDKQQDFYDFCVSESNQLKETLEKELRAYVSP